MTKVDLKIMKTKASSRKREHGFSIIEMLVCVVIIGIATFGLTELLWVNTVWSSRLHNRFDNITSAQVFLNSMQRDFKSASLITPLVPSGLVLESFQLVIPEFDTDGYVKTIDKNSPVIYEVSADADPDSTFYKISRRFKGNTIIVMRNIVGPVSNGKTSIFNFVNRPSTTSLSDVAAVAIRLQLRKEDLNKSLTASKEPIVEIRKLTVLRNGGIHEP